MPDQVRAVAKQLGEHRRLHFEVVSLERRALAEAGAAGNEQRPALGELALLSPGDRRPDDVAVDEDDRRPVPNPFHRKHGWTNPTITRDEADHPGALPERGGVAPSPARRAAARGRRIRR